MLEVDWLKQISTENGRKKKPMFQLLKTFRSQAKIKYLEVSQQCVLCKKSMMA